MGLQRSGHQCRELLLLLTCHAAQHGKSPFRMEEAAPSLLCNIATCQSLAGLGGWYVTSITQLF